MKSKLPLPRIGLRMIKSAVSVGLCFLIYVLRGYHGIPFYAALAALQCIQPYKENTKQMAVQRASGTLIGAFYGLIVLVLQCFVLVPRDIPYVWYCLMVSVGVIFSLYTAVLLKRKSAAYFSCVVFLCITMVHIGDENPWLFVLNRVTDTMIGIGIGMLVNSFHLPRTRRKDILFVISMDEVLFSRSSTLSLYSKTELNRILDSGVPLSIMTMRTTASFLEAMGDIRVKLPLIVMDGAAIYDPVTGSYPAKRELPYEDAARLMEFLRGFDLETFQNVIAQDSVLLFYQKINSPGAQRVYDRLRKSPYRNYLNFPLPEGVPVVYLMAMDRTEKIQAAYAALQASGDTEKYRVVCYDSDDDPGFSFLKIYRKDAAKLEMLETLKELTGFSQVRTLGSIPGEYDEYIEASSGDDVVRRIRQEYEPLIWKAKKTKS